MKHEKQVFSLSVLAVLIFTALSASFNSSQLSSNNIDLNPFYSSAEAAQLNDSIIKESPTSKLVGEGRASFYANQFHGRTTANGETFNMNQLTAAHPSLPFGTWVRVTNLRTGKDVVVRINDRGPFVKGRIIDLSIGAAKELGILKSGTAQVKLETIGSGNRRSSAG